MAIEVYENKEAGKRVTIDRRVCQTASGELVEDGHVEAATLYASAGKEVSRAEFEALGGVVKSAAKPKPEPKPKAEPKADAKPKAAPKPKPKPKPRPKPKPKPRPKPKPKRETTKKGK